MLKSEATFKRIHFVGCEIAESMDILQFCDRTDELYYEAEPGTNLKQMRKNAGLSQSELAELTGISVRTIQQYEQRQKNINRAQGDYLVRFSRALMATAWQPFWRRKKRGKAYGRP